MIRNYNLLSGSRDTRLKNQDVIDVDISPTSITSNKGKSSTYVGWLLMAFLLMFSVGVNAQANSYGFATSTGAALDPMVGATVIGVGPNDDTCYAASNIGFDFVFESTTFTQFSASPDGFIRLGGGTAANQFTNQMTSTTNIPKIAALWDDVALGSLAGGGSIRVLTDGAVGSRICKIQWFVTIPRNLSGPANSTFQMWLYETSNVIEFRYGTVNAPGSASVGIVGSPSTNFQSVTISSNTSSSITANDGNATAPAVGRMYTFTPPSACTGTPTAGTIPANAGICSGGTGATLTVTGFSTGVSGISFLWEESDDNGVVDPWGPAVGGTGAATATYVTPSLVTPMYYRCRVTCGPSTLFANTNSSFVSVINCTFDVALSSATYTSIMPANGGSGNTYTGWSGTFNGDDIRTGTVSLAGTSFTYQGNPVSGFQATTNGWMTFNTANTSATFTNNLTATGQNRVLAPFWDDLVTTGNSFASVDSCMRYQVIGTLGSGTAVIVIEWAAMERFANPGPNLNFQVRLYEAGNKIEYVYGNFEGFDGTLTSAYTYSVGYNGSNPAGTTASDRFGMQTSFTNHFAASDPATNNVMPPCFSKVTLTPGIYTGPVTAPTIPAPSNDNSANAAVLTVNSAPCASYCGTYYTSRSATNSGFGVSNCTTTAGNEDDDVWFSFVTDSGATDYLIRLRSAPDYNGVLQLLDSAFNPIACVNATGAGLIETINAVGLNNEETYYLRVFHDGVGIGTGNGQFSICVSSVINPPVNDNIGGAISLTHASACVPTNSILPATLAATASPQPVCGGTADDDVWYTTTFVTSEATVTVQSGAGYNAHVEIFTSSDNTPTGTLTSIGCFNATSTGGAEVINVTGAVPGGVIFIRVYHSLGGTGSGNFSICVTFPPAPACILPTVSPANGATDVVACPDVTLSWAAVAGATSYDVYFDAGAGPATTLISPAQAGTSYTTSGSLAYSTLYSWRVVARNGTGPATGCSDFTFTTGAQSSVSVAPANPSIACGGDAVVLTVGGFVNPTPPIACLNEANGQFGSFTGTANCDGTTVNTVTTAGFAAEYSNVNVGASLYTFTSSISGDLIAITSADGLTTYAYGPSPLTWNNNVGATAIRFYTQTAACDANTAFRVRAFTCTSPSAVFSPATGLFTDLALTTPYDGVSAVNTVYALPTATQIYTVTSTNACLLPISVTVTVAPCSTTVNLKLFVEGYYSEAIGGMTAVSDNQIGVFPPVNPDVELITVELHEASAPYTLVDTTTAMLQTDGSAVCVYPSAPSGSYYIAVKTRNTVQTWSATPQTVGAVTLNYDFSTAASQAFGDNMIEIEPGVFAFYSGDINSGGAQDDLIDSTDYSVWETDNNNFEFGVFATDLNGDGIVDGSDYSIWEANNNNFIFANYPQ